MKTRIFLFFVLALMSCTVYGGDKCCTETPKTVSESEEAPTPPAKSDEEIIKEQLSTYPLDTCVVSGDELKEGGEMGDPVNYVHEGRLVRFCCKDCVDDFKKNPAKYLAKIDAAAKEKAEHKDGTKKEDEHKGHEHHNH